MTTNTVLRVILDNKHFVFCPFRMMENIYSIIPACKKCEQQDEWDPKECTLKNGPVIIMASDQEL